MLPVVGNEIMGDFVFLYTFIYFIKFFQSPVISLAYKKHSCQNGDKENNFLKIKVITKLRTLEKIQNTFEQHWFYNVSYLIMLRFRYFIDWSSLMGISTIDVQKKKNLRNHLWHCCIGAKTINAHHIEVEFLKLETRLQFSGNSISFHSYLELHQSFSHFNMTKLIWTLKVKGR